MAIEFAWFIPVDGDGEHLGLPRPEREPDYDYLKSVAKKAEEVGFSTLLIPTINQTFSYASDAHAHEAWITASAIAAVTEKIRLLVAFRPGQMQPGIVAKMGASLDHLSKGRFEINIVPGGWPKDSEMYGDELSHDERYERALEFSLLLKRLWTEDRVSHDGKYYELDEAIVSPKPVQKPFPPFYLGGSSEVAKRFAAKEIDTYLFWGEPLESIKNRIEEMDRLAHEEGRTLKYGLRIHIFVRDTEEEAWKAARELISRPDERVTNQLKSGYQTTDSVGQNRLVDLQQGDYVIGPNLWSGISTVRQGAGTALVGTPEQVAARLQEYADLGVSLFILSGYPHLEEAERVGKQVLPLLKNKIQVSS